MTIFQCDSCNEWYCDKCGKKYECVCCEKKICSMCVAVRTNTDKKIRAFCSETCFFEYEEERFPKEEDK